jgi:hypothetical protein
MSLADAVKSYGKIKNDLNKKGSSHIWSGAGKSLISIGASLAKLDKSMSVNRASHESFQAGADALGLDSEALKGTTYDAPDENQSFFSKFTEGVRENFTKAKNMEGTFSKNIDGKEYTYDANRVTGVGVALGTSKEALSMQATYRGEYGDKWKDRLIQDFGTEVKGVVEPANVVSEAEPEFDRSSYIKKIEETNLGVHESLSEKKHKVKGGNQLRSGYQTMSNKELKQFYEELSASPSEEKIVDGVIEEDKGIFNQPTSFSDFKDDDKIAFGEYFKEYGEEGVGSKFNYGDLTSEQEIAQTTHINQAKNMQNIMNRMGYDVGGSEDEWRQHGGKTWGKKSLSAYQSLYNEWSS